MIFNPSPIKQKFAELFQLAQGDQKIYLVGGVVRDLVLGREYKDIDVLCELDSFQIARKWADLNKGAFYLLDEERGAARVILDQGGKKLVFDFVRQQGESLEEDLSARDFSINSLVIDFTSLETIIDPLHGLDDLQNGRLRPCSSISFTLDPVRVIRAFRYAAAYSLSIDAETRSLIKLSVDDLKSVSGERKRDELFKILDLDHPIRALEQLNEFNIFQQLEIPSDASDSFPLVSSLVDWFALIRNEARDTNSQDNSAATPLFRYFKPYADLLGQRNTSNRNLKQLLLLYPLLSGLTEMRIASHAQNLLLTNDEVHRLLLLKKYQTAAENLLNKEQVITDREMFLFFNQTEAAGLDLCLLILAQQTSLGKKKIVLDQAGKLFECWFDHPQIVNPIPLLNGNDLMMNFDLTPGPVIGKLINQLREEQAAGEISDRQQALDWMEVQVSSLKNNQYWEKRDSEKPNN